MKGVVVGCIWRSGHSVQHKKQYCVQHTNLPYVSTFKYCCMQIFHKNAVHRITPIYCPGHVLHHIQYSCQSHQIYFFLEYLHFLVTYQCSSWSWKTTGCTNLHKLIFIVNPRWRRCPTRITTWCTKIAPPFALIGRFLQLQAQNNADENPKKPKGSRKMTGRWKNDRALRKDDRALNKTTGRCALSFRPSENPGDTVLI